MKKIFAVVVAIAMVMALAVPAFAFEGSQDVVLVVYEQATWSNIVSDPVTINAPGEYTFKLSGLSVDSAQVATIYIKDATAVAEGDSFTGTSNLSDLSVLTKSIKINGEEVALTEGYGTGLTDAGVLDIGWYNIWWKNFIELPAGTITDVEVVVEVVDAAEAAEAPAAEEAPAADAAPAETAEAPETGIALAVVPAVIALAAAVISKRR